MTILPSMSYSLVEMQISYPETRHRGAMARSEERRVPDAGKGPPRRSTGTTAATRRSPRDSQLPDSIPYGLAGVKTPGGNCNAGRSGCATSAIPHRATTFPIQA